MRPVSGKVRRARYAQLSWRVLWKATYQLEIMKKRHWWIAAFGLFCALIVVFVFNYNRIPGGETIVLRLRGKATVADRVAQFGPVARTRWQPHFQKKDVAYPPQKLLLVGLKREKRLQVYAANSGQSLKFIHSFPVLGLSGKLGPKLRYGDFQVPEGFYRITSFNPNSAFHLSVQVNYPNAFDKMQAKKEGRDALGGQIMIHGSNASIGCLAMGDEAAEDLFVLASQVGVENTEIILSPLDFRTSNAPVDARRPAWVKKLYAEIKAALMKLPSR